jgi:2'-5' RNA ligase
MIDEKSARVFLAIGLSLAATEALAELQRVLRNNTPAGLFRFVDPSQAHVTLRFLGRCTANEQTRVVQAASAAASGSAPFRVAFGGLGVFPDERRAHILWLGLTEGKAELVRLAGRLETELEKAGFAPEARPFAPHLTIARMKQRPPPGMVKALLAANTGSTDPAPVTIFSLMESRTVAGQVRYLPLSTFSLEDACTPSK